ncbi:MAG TPA: nucleotidyltransferase family protein [Terriglobales bacterium]
MGLGGVILAAGESSRMGRDKALLPWPPESARILPQAGLVTGGTLLSAAIEALGRYCDMVIVVGGNNEDTIRPVAYSCGAFFARNPEPERGQFSSLQTGLHEVINRGRDAAMISLVDRPPAKATTFAKLVDAFQKRDHSRWTVVPEFEGKHGHPILIGPEMIEIIITSPVTSNARDIEHANQKHIVYLPVDDSRVTMNINTPEDYTGLGSSFQI